MILVDHKSRVKIKNDSLVHYCFNGHKNIQVGPDPAGSMISWPPGSRSVKKLRIWNPGTLPSVLDPDWIRIRIESDQWIRIQIRYLDPDSESGFGIRIRNRDLDPARQERKKAHKNIRNVRNFMFLTAGCPLLRAEGFFCSLDVLLEAWGKVNCNIIFFKFFYNCKFFPIFGHQTWSLIGPGSVFSLKCWIRIWNQ